MNWTRCLTRGWCRGFGTSTQPGASDFRQAMFGHDAEVAFDAPNARIVAVSGYAQPEDVARSAEAGFDEHIAKPPEPDRIARVLALA